jgi:hypothetical protein
VQFSEPRNIEAAFLSYNKDLFRSRRLEEVEELLSGLEGRVSAEMNVALLQPCNLKKVNPALQPFKAPSPKGFPTSFYQHN